MGEVVDLFPGKGGEDKKDPSEVRDGRKLGWMDIELTRLPAFFVGKVVSVVRNRFGGKGKQPVSGTMRLGALLQEMSEVDAEGIESVGYFTRQPGIFSPEAGASLTELARSFPAEVALNFKMCFFMPWGRNVMSIALAYAHGDLKVVKGFVSSAFEVEDMNALPDWVKIWMVEFFKMHEELFAECYTGLIGRDGGKNDDFLAWLKEEVEKKQD